MKKKKVHKLDIVDAMWDNIDKMRTSTNVVVNKDTTWKEYILLCCVAKGLDISNLADWQLEHGAKSWLWEKEFLFRKPVRTMKHFYGEHVMLYDVFGCKKHHVLVTTYDDSRIVWDATVLCPICNEENFQTIEPKEYPLEHRVVEDDEEWEIQLLWAKNHKKDVKWSNFKYRLKNNPKRFWWKLKRWVKPKLEKGAL